MRFQANLEWPNVIRFRRGVVVLIAIAGCFHDPDANKLVCQVNEQCPTGYWCTTEHKCSDRQISADASAVSVDLRVFDTDAPVAVDSGPADILSIPPDSMVAPIDASDLAGVSLDAAEVQVPDTAGLDALVADTRLTDAATIDSTDAPLAASGDGGGTGGVAGGGSGGSGIGTGGIASSGGIVGSGGSLSSSGGVGSGGVMGTGGVIGTGGAANSGGVPSTGGTVVTTPVINSFTATPATITSGKIATLNWSVTGATSLSIAGIGTVSGSQWTVSPAQNTTYVLTAQNATGGSTSAQVVLAVVAVPSISSFAADAGTVLPGGSTKLKPVFSGGTGMIDQSIGTTVTSGNSYDTGALSAKTTFTLTVTNVAGDAVTAMATVAVVGFVSAGTMSVSRIHHTATLLDSGRILLAGGYTGSGTYQSGAELYDESAGTFIPITTAMSSARGSHTATRLGNGKVLLAGGNDTNTTCVASADLYDPSAGTTGGLTAVPVAMTTARRDHTATLLPNGQVLLAGGTDGTASALWSAELYDPSVGNDGTFRATTTNMLSARRGHIAVSLPSGQVLIAGGHGISGTLSAAELYFNGSFTATGAMKSAREAHTAVVLANGKVLISGGYNGVSIVATAEIYDPQTGSFTTPDTSMSIPRVTPESTRLTDNTVLITGGEINPTANPLAADLYDPASGSSGTLRATAPLLTARMGHTATLLKSGRVLIAGGAGSVAATELYVY